MKFLCDVHISHKVVKYLKEKGYEAIHVNDILDSYYSTDKSICAYADQHDFIVLTKDADFKNSFLISHTPQKLIKVNLGNISTQRLIDRLGDIFSAIESLSSTKEYMVSLDINSANIIQR